MRGRAVDTEARRSQHASAHPVLPVLATAIALVVIGIATLRAGDASDSRSDWCMVCPPSGSRVGVDLLLNVLLFVPYGAALAAMRLGWVRAIAAVVVTTLAIELLQIDIIPGRYPSIADIATNTLGGIVGIGSTHRWRTVMHSGPVRARSLAAAVTACWLALVAGSAIAATPSTPDAAYHVRWRPDQGPIDPARGGIVDARIDGMPVPPSDRSAHDPLLEPYRLGEPIRLDVLLVPSAPSGKDVRFEITTEGRPIRVVLGQNGSDALLRVHFRASDARLRAPTVRLADVLTAGSRSPFRDTVALTGEVSRERLLLQATVGGRRTERELRLGPHLGWSFLLPGRLGLPPFARTLADALWLSFLLIPAAYFARRSLSRGDAYSRAVAGSRDTVSILAVVALLLFVGLAFIPALVGVSPTPAPAWAAAIICALVGWVAGGRVMRRRVAHSDPIAH